LDIIPSMAEIENFAAALLPGRLLEIGPVVLATGGAVSNTGQALHKLGINTYLMGKVGMDALGEVTLEVIKKLSPHLIEKMILSSDEPSSYTIILNPPNVDRIFIHYPGPNNTFRADDIDYALLQEVALFHFGYPTLMQRMYEQEGTELIALFRRAKAAGVTTALDLTIPDPKTPAGQANWPAILRQALPYVDLFVPSIEETLFTLYPETFNQVTSGQAQITPTLLSSLADDLLRLGVKIVLLKLGEQGMYLRTADEAALSQMGRAACQAPARWANRELWAPAFQVPVVGTTGAGDSAIAGFFAALLRDLSPVEAITIAAAVGACNVEAADALGGVRSWEETLSRLQGDWSRYTLDIKAAGWRFEVGQQLWLGPHDRPE
jgi:sugar/nucleoside kinase (ribokinase family)